MEIAIERLLFDEYAVAVYEDQELILDKKYYCANYISAQETAKVLLSRYPEAEINFY